MHRHHPYGGSGYEERRRSASPGGRFPRSDRGGPGRGGYGRGGGASRGRGRGSSGPSYPPPPPPQYGGYDSGPAYDSYGHPPYESRYGGGGGGGGGNGGYGYNGPPPPPVHDSYGRDDGYDSYGPSYGPPYEQDAWREDDRGPPPPRRRRDRDERQREALIEDRINRERPCRTLFIRNIKYESDSAALRRQFEEHGMIRTFFDLISSRGMLFVTYYDIRAAQAARDRLQGLEVNGRPVSP
ncbi:hypothetical protein DL93DRAFT_37658 [Clavulina sp. PMI_390]|nr:hypothetical protein DL93DRAFT_37658 [Clavulina sp. PMI_390]